MGSYTPRSCGLSYTYIPPSSYSLENKVWYKSDILPPSGVQGNIWPSLRLCITLSENTGLNPINMPKCVVKLMQNYIEEILKC